MKTYVAVAILVIAVAGAGYYFAYMPGKVATELESQNTREAQDAAVSTRAACEAGCRDQYGGSGSAGFDACIRACGAGGVLREECPSERPACPEGGSVVCRRGAWYCRDAGARVFPETNNLNFPTDSQLREGACGEPGLACESPTTPECRNGKWTCIPPATGVR